MPTDDAIPPKSQPEPPLSVARHEPLPVARHVTDDEPVIELGPVPPPLPPRRRVRDAPPVRRAKDNTAVIVGVVLSAVGGLVLVLIVTGRGLDRQRTYTREEFRSRVMGKTRDEVIAAVGRPDETNTVAWYRVWHYHGRTLRTRTPVGRTETCGSHSSSPEGKRSPWSHESKSFWNKRHKRGRFVRR